MEHVLELNWFLLCCDSFWDHSGKELELAVPVSWQRNVRKS